MTVLTVLKSVGVILLGIILIYEITRNEALEDENGRLMMENFRLWLLIRGKGKNEREVCKEEPTSPFEEFENLKS